MAPSSTTESATASKSSTQMKIFLRVRKTISVKVKSSDTVGSLKSKINKKSGIPIDSQALSFNENYLDGHETLLRCFIKNGSILDLAVLGMQIFVKVPSRTGEILELRVKEYDIIKMVKFKIREELEIPPDEQTLTYNGIPLEDGYTLASYDIHNESTLVLVIRPNHDLKIFLILPNKKTITLDTKTWYTIREVKAMIESMINIEDSRLLYCGDNLEDCKSFADYKIKQKATLVVMSNMHILVKPLMIGKITIIRLEVDSLDPIESVKERIEVEVGICAIDMKLIYVGKQLEEGKTLADYKINNGSVLHVIPKIWAGECGNPDTVNKVNVDEVQDQSDPEGEAENEEESDTQNDPWNYEEESEAESKS